MILCEYRFEALYARGDDRYLNLFANYLDVLFRDGWIAHQVKRDPALKGWWQLCLAKDGDS
ncbi:MAG: hypothetical protein WA634_09045 [Silvibacterium sp.]